MKYLALVGVLLLGSAARAEPVVIDLSAEKREYETKVQSRTGGLVLLGATVVAGAATLYGLSSAQDARATLLAQRTPVDLSARRDLVAAGEQAQVLGIAGAVLGIAVGLGCVYLLTVSF